MSGAEIPIIMAIGGTALGIAGDQAEAQEVAKQARASARLKDIQAKEIIARGEINAEEATEQAEQLVDFMRSRQGASGGESTSSIAMLADTQIALRKQILNISREAQFNAFILREEARESRRLGREVGTAAGIRAAGSILQTGSSIAGSTGGAKKPAQGLT